MKEKLQLIVVLSDRGGGIDNEIQGWLIDHPDYKVGQVVTLQSDCEVDRVLVIFDLKIY